jgi:hypothetical protein
MPLPLRCLVLALGLLLAACASGPGTRQEALDRALYDYSGAIRWNNFELAYEAIDPETRRQRPMSDFDFERLRQVQVTSYTVVANSTLADGSVVREVQIGLVNRHTMAERTVRVRETWRYDAEAKRWWQSEGLPDVSPGR